MTKFMPINARINEILAADDNEIETAINKSILDVLEDCMNPYKSQKDARKVVLEISIAQYGSDQMAIGYKVTPKLAPYTCAPQKEKVPEGQTTIFDAEIVEQPEPIDPARAIENENRYLMLTGGKKRKGKKKE